MEKLNSWTELSIASFKNLFQTSSDFLPNIFGAILILFFGWLANKIIAFFIRKACSLFKVDALSKTINQKGILGRKLNNLDITKIILLFVKSVLFLISIILAFEVLELQAVSSVISNLLWYLPKLFGAIALFILGLYIANFIKNALNKVFDSFDLAGSNLIGNFVFYIIITIVAVAAINQAGVDTSIISNNLTVILFIVLTSIGLSFALGSKDVITKLLKSYYVRKKYSLGEKIAVNDHKGTIETIDSISLTLKTTTSRIVIPISEIVNNNVEVFD
tara:strand:+ start:1370 stop:2197 length:828 start_codon:yes stop_codon:yes gene_type:complete